MSNRTGISVPLYSLRSKGEAGIGDFGDIAAMVDLACTLGVGKVVLQSVLDTSFDGGGEPVYPIYIDLRQLPETPGRARMANYSAAAAALDSQESIDYQKVYSAKMHLMRERFFWEGADVLGSEAYHTFWRANRNWIERYSVYCSLRHNYGTGNSRHVIEGDYESMLADAHFINEYSDDIKFHLYVQFLLHTQLRQAVSFAAGRGIILEVSNETPRNVFFRPWWRGLDDQERQRVYRDSLGLPGPAPASPEPWIAEALIRKKLSGGASEAIIALEDLIAMTSLPGCDGSGAAASDAPESWHYRMNLTLTELLSHTSLLECLSSVLEESAK